MIDKTVICFFCFCLLMATINYAIPIEHCIEFKKMNLIVMFKKYIVLSNNNHT